MKTKLLAVLLFAGSALFAAPAVVVGVGVGAPVPVAAYVGRAPGPGYVWVAGYMANGYWVQGYWNFVGVRYGGPVVRFERGFDRGWDRHFDRDRDRDRGHEGFRR